MTSHALARSAFATVGANANTPHATAAPVADRSPRSMAMMTTVLTSRLRECRAQQQRLGAIEWTAYRLCALRRPSRAAFRAPGLARQKMAPPGRAGAEPVRWPALD